MGEVTRTFQLNHVAIVVSTANPLSSTPTSARSGSATAGGTPQAVTL